MSRNDGRTEEIVQMWEAGLGLTQIASEFGTSTAIVRRHLATKGISPDQDVVKDYEPAVIEAYQKGVSIKAITLKHNISTAKVYDVLAKNDIPIRKVAQRDAKQRQMDEAVQMYKDGAMLKEILAETGVPQPTLHNELHARGVRLRRPRRR